MIELLKTWRGKAKVFKHSLNRTSGPEYVSNQRPKGELGRRLRIGDDGNAIIETAFIFPILLMILVSIWQFGLVYSNFVVLTQATSSGAQLLMKIRLTTSDPCDDVFKAITKAAPTLDSSKISMKLTFDATSTTATSCPDQKAKMTQGGTVSVEAYYPYQLTLYGIPLTNGSLDSGAISEIEN